MKIAFIGGGNMATALISSLLASAQSIHTIRVADPDPATRARLTKRWSLACFSAAPEAIADMDAIVLAVKPQVLPVVLKEIADHAVSSQLIISIAAGITIQQIAAKLPARPAIIRCMSNTPALIGLGMTGLYAQEKCSARQRELAHRLMQAAGEVVWLDTENLLDVVTAVSGSGPAYFFYLIESMQVAGMQLGLPCEVAAKLALQTAYGSGAMAVQSELDVASLRRQVTTPGGTTEAALRELEAGHFKDLLISAIDAATQRGQELANGVAK